MADPSFQPSGGQVPDTEREAVKRIVELAQVFEKGVGLEFKLSCERRWRQYRGFKQFRSNWHETNGQNDRDGLLYEAKEDWGAHLHIPLSYQTIETIVPKAIAQAPEMLVVPRDEQWRKNVEAIKLLLERQQDQIDIDLAYQMVMRAGRIYGLGVGKDYWRHEVTSRRKVQPKVFARGFKVGQLTTEVTFDDPMFEDVDPLDFLWDPYGYDTRTCEWMAHRVWMSTRAVWERIKTGAWNTASAQALTEEDVRRLGGNKERYDETLMERLTTSGFPTWAASTSGERGEQPHEVLEFHDGHQVISVLDRSILVQMAESPCCGMMPFQVYRPTPQQKMMVGIGDLEPIEHLQREIDALRSTRRMAAALALSAPLAFDDGLINEKDVNFAPGVLIPVNGNPNEAINHLQIRDVPASGYQEEQAIMANIEGVTGLSDALAAQGGGVAQTATEAQLVQASLSARIQLGSRRYEIEVVRPSGRAFLCMDQRMILENRSALMVPGDPSSPEDAYESGDWRQYPIGPGELMGEYEIQMEGGSMAARNIPQDRQDAVALLQNFGNSPYVNPTKPLERALELFGIKHPKAWMKAEEPPVPAMALAFLKLAGVDPQLIEQAVLKARTVAAPHEAPGEGPGTQMVNSILGGQGAPQEGAEGV